MAVGDNTANSVIWVAGESKGYNVSGATTAVPSVSLLAGAVNVGSATPTVAPTGSPYFVNTKTQKESFWDGTSWLPVSGA